MQDPKMPIGGYPSDYPHTPEGAGIRTNNPTSRFKRLRASDSLLIAEGKDPEGPVWAYDSRGRVIYFEKDLQAWLRRSFVRVIEGGLKLKPASNLPSLGSVQDTASPLDTGDTPPAAA